jgi:hypothetical protein
VVSFTPRRLIPQGMKTLYDGVIYVSYVHTVVCFHHKLWRVSPLKVGRLLTDYAARTLHNSIRKFDSCSIGQEFPCLLCNSKLHYHVDRSPPLIPVLNHINVAYKLCSFKIYFNNITLPSTLKYLSKRKKICRIYCHVLVTRHGVWIGNWIYWKLINYNCT